MADRHLNLFYTYNRDSELIENNLTRAFVVFLSIVSSEARNNILSTLFERSHKTINNTADAGGLVFSNASFALQSNIDRYLTKRSGRQLLLTISTEPLDITSSVAESDARSANEGENGSDFTSVPDAWIYDETRNYCILIEAKVGSYPLNVGQLQAHARDWFGSDLQRLNSRNSLYSITWIDVLVTLRDAIRDHSYVYHSEVTLLSHMMEFIGFYGYRLFKGFDFSGLNAPPDLIIGHLPSPRSMALDLSFDQLRSPPDFILMY